MSEPTSEPSARFSALRQKRIAFYTDDPGEGGVAIYTHAVACALAKAGCNVAIIQSRFDGPLQQMQRDVGVHHQWLPYSTLTDGNRTAKDPRDAQEAFAAVRPDVIVFSNRDPLSNIAAKGVARQQSIPYIIVEHYVYPVPAADAVWMAYQRQAIEQHAGAKAVIAVSQNNLDLLHTDFGLARSKGQVIHNGRPAEYFQPPDATVRQSLRHELNVGPDDLLCLTVGRLVPVKGYDCLLVAIDQLRDKPIWSQLHFVWIGDGPLRPQLQNTLEMLGVADRVHLLGHLPNVADWLDASDVFILTSRCEGMPLSIMEAMAKGLPVMASAVSGVPEELGPTGQLLTPPGETPEPTVSEIVATLAAWTHDAALRRAIGQAGKARAEIMFREERMVDETARVIERALLP